MYSLSYRITEIKLDYRVRMQRLIADLGYRVRLYVELDYRVRLYRVKLQS